MNAYTPPTSPRRPSAGAEWIRVSCASLCRVHHASRGYFLLLNQNRRQKGVYELTPIGGALQLYDETVLTRFGAVLENPSNLELRVMLPLERLDAFRTWFYSENGRERSPFRELQEELVHETQLLPALTEQDVTCARLWTLERERLTERSGQTGLLTHYFLETYEATFREAVLGQLIAAPAGTGARWLKREQLAEQQSIVMQIDGAERTVRVQGRVLLDPRETPADVIVYPPHPGADADDSAPPPASI